MRTDSEGKASYKYARIYNGQTLNYYLHYYDEGLFYNGFWVVNDLETGFIETEGRVFIYNSENDDCPEVSKNIFVDDKERQEIYYFPLPGNSRLLVHLGGRGLAVQY